MSSHDDTDSWDAPLFDPTSENPKWTPAHVKIDAAGLSHAGYVRTNNEDHFLIARFGRFLESVQSNLPAEEVPARHEALGNALLVADGLGGHAAGETASRSALRILYSLVADTPDWILRVDEKPLSDKVECRAEERLAQISERMTQQANVHSELRGFGTTLTAAWGIAEKWFVAHLGDSRAYRFRQGVLQQLTHDHTVAQELADAGLIDPHDIALHSLRNRLTRMLGDQTQNTSPQIRPFTVADGDVLLLCTDGLTDMVDDTMISEILAVEQAAALCSRRLMDAALSAGGNDNVTAIVARVRITTSD